MSKNIVESLYRVTGVDSKDIKNESFTMKDPTDGRKKVIIPDDLESFLNSKEWNTIIRNISKYCRGNAEPNINHDTYYLNYSFKISSKYNVDDVIDTIFSDLGISQEDSSMGNLHGWGYSEFEGTKLINGIPIKLSASYGFRIISITILYKLKEIPEYHRVYTKAETEYNDAFSEYSKDNSEENREKLLKAKKKFQADHKKRIR